MIGKDRWIDPCFCLFLSLYCKRVIYVFSNTLINCKLQLLCLGFIASITQKWDFNILLCSSKIYSEEQIRLIPVVNAWGILLKVHVYRRVAARRLGEEMRISGFRTDTEFYFTIFQSWCSKKRYVSCEFD